MDGDVVYTVRDSTVPGVDLVTTCVKEIVASDTLIARTSKEVHCVIYMYIIYHIIYHII